MGYDTEFWGHVTVTPPLNPDEISYLKDFSDSRRFARRSGPYAVTGGDHRGPDTIDYNDVPDGQHSLWCDWTPSDDGTLIGWNGTEKFHYPERWMRYLIDTFLKPGATLTDELKAPRPDRYYDGRFSSFTFDHVVSGEIGAQGEDPGDKYFVVVEANEARKVDA
jgi:hypothetical protein